jgi:RNA polymerase sigma-70 factor (ECF subfamily)
MPPLDEQGFGEFYRQHARPLWAYVYRVTGNAADADDLVQDAFCRFLNADTAALGEEDRRRYLFRIAGNAITDRWRRAGRERSWLARMRGEPEPATPSADDDDVTRTFAALKPRDRALLWLAYVEEHSHEEIADTLGVKRSSVKVLLARARTRLRELLTVRMVL